MTLVRTVLIAVALSFSFSSVACAKASTLKEDQPISGGLGKYPTVAVESRFESPDAEKEAAGFDGRLTERVIEQLKGKGVFAKIDKASAGPADLMIKLTITKASKGSSLNQMVGTGNDATVDVTTELVDAKDSKSIGKFQVHADSSRSSSVSVGGVDTQTGSNPLNRAVDSAAAEIGGHVASKK